MAARNKELVTPKTPIVPLIYLSFDPTLCSKNGTYLASHQGIPFSYLWGLYQFTNKRSPLFTIEARLIVDYWHNFCGGGRFYSPQVNLYHNGDTSWGDRSFAMPGGYSSNSFTGRPLTFQNMTKQDKNVIPSLNRLLNLDAISSEAASTIMWNSLTANFLGYMARQNKAFWVGADRVDSGRRLTELVKNIETWTGKLGFCSPMFGGMNIHTANRGKSGYSISCPQGMTKYSAKVHRACGVNWNTMGQCAVYTVMPFDNMGSERRLFGEDMYTASSLMNCMPENGKCPNCEEEHTLEIDEDGNIFCFGCGTDVPIPLKKMTVKSNEELYTYKLMVANVASKMRDPLYMSFAPYYMWGN